MKAWCHILVSLAFLAMNLFPAASRAEPRFFTDLSGGLTVREELRDTTPLSPGPGLRLDFGRQLGSGFALLGTLAWYRLGGGDEEPCYDCLQTETANTLLGGMLLRYSFPLTRAEFYVQFGAGGLFDIVSHTGGLDGEGRTGFGKQLAFINGFGLGFPLSTGWVLGGRLDTLLGDNLKAVTFSGFGGYRF